MKHLFWLDYCGLAIGAVLFANGLVMAFGHGELLRGGIVCLLCLVYVLLLARQVQQRRARAEAHERGELR